MSTVILYGPFLSSCNVGQLHFDTVSGGQFRYLGGDPRIVLNWLLVGGALVGDPDVSQWGVKQDGAYWFNRIDNVFKSWDGSQIVVAGGGSGGSIDLLENGVSIGLFQGIDFVDGTNTTVDIQDQGGGVAEVVINASGGGSGISPFVLVNLDGVGTANQTGTYVRVGTLVTCTVSGNTLQVGHLIRFDATSGSAADGNFVITAIVTPGSVFQFTHSGSGDTSGDMQLVQAAFVGSTSRGVSNVARLATGQYAVNFSGIASSNGYVIALGYTGLMDIATTGGTCHYYLRTTKHVRIAGTQSDGVTNSNLFSISVTIFDVGA